MKNDIYDKLKWIAQIFLPAFSTFLFAIGKIWNLPYYIEVTSSMTAFDAFLGIVLGISSANYYKVENANEEELG